MNKTEYDLEEAQKQAQRDNAIAMEKARKELLDNHTAVQNLLAEVVKQAAGWTELDSWAQNALDGVKLGKKVDIEQLKTDINNWIVSKGNN